MGSSRKSPTASSERAARPEEKTAAGAHATIENAARGADSDPEAALCRVPGPVDVLEARVRAMLAAHHVTEDMRLCVALSGGLDSMVLLELAHRLQSRSGYALSALHVHHGLSRHADMWAAFCRAVCDERKIPLQVRHVDARPAPGENLEDKARTLRYACFLEAPADILLLAHHLDDQCETLLLRLLRGSGLQGLLGMPTSRMLGGEATTRAAAMREHGPLLLRPLLGSTREEVAGYALAAGLRWIEDDSNDDQARTRNFLRGEVFPRIETRFPGYRRSLARAVENLVEDAAIIEQRTAEDLAAAGTTTLDMEVLVRIGSARALNTLRAFLASRGCRPPPRATLLETWRQLRDARADARVCVAMERGDLRRFQNRVHWVPRSPGPGMESTVLWHGEESIALPGACGTLRFRSALGEGIRAADMERGRVQICHAQGGMRLKLEERRPTRTLKNLFQEHSVPPWLRRIAPALRVGTRNLWVAGLGYDCRHRAAPGEAGVCVEWISATSD